MINSETKRSRLGRKTLAAVFGGALLLSACAAPRATYTPYPPEGKSAQEYNSDIATCQAWATSQSGASPQRAVTEGAEGAVFGAALGALICGILGGGNAAAKCAALGGGAGAFGGGTLGYEKAQKTYNIAYDNCFREKGYLVQ